jgi:hypothetical protein
MADTVLLDMLVVIAIPGDATHRESPEALTEIPTS